MKEKKQTNRLSYSVFGKYFRGFLCLITFCVFCVSTILSIYAVGTYGTDIIVDPEYHYSETGSYQIEVGNEIRHVLNHCNMLGFTSVESSDIAMMDVENQEIHYYSKEYLGEDLYYDNFYATSLKDLEVYEQRESFRYEGVNLSDYQQMKAYLSESDYPSDYLYFDKSSFRALFEQDGLQNTNYRFSDEFSEEAYFIFENFEVTTRETKIEGPTVSSTESIGEKATAEEATTEAIHMEKAEISTEKLDEENTTTEAVDEENTSEAEVSVVKETVTQEIVITPYNLTSYAVYDPEQGIYYSTQDEYFSDMGTYIYQTDVLLDYILEQEDNGTYYYSLVIPLLRNYNYSMYEMAESNSGEYEMILSVQNELDSCADRGVYYYLQNDKDIVYSNVKDIKEIEALDNYYTFKKKSDGEIKQIHSAKVPDLTDLYIVEEYFSAYPEESAFYLGFEDFMSKHFYANVSSFVLHNEEYPFYRDNSLILLIVAIVSFLLLMVQAFSLIGTTGRRYKGDEEVALNFYDRIFTEIWIGLSGVILMASIAFGFMCIEEFTYMLSIGSMVCWTIVGSVVFGFCFMVLTLSFVRRIKAHNWIEQMILVKLVKHIKKKRIEKQSAVENGDAELERDENASAVKKTVVRVWDKFKHRYYNIEGTKKLLLMVVVFMIVELMVVLVRFNSTMYREISIMIFVILQVVALVAVVRVIKDIDKLTNGVKEITQGNLDSKVEINEKISVFGDLADGINHIGDGLKNAVETSLKDERMKTELITNVSHDLKTPLTSIINYVNLLKKEEVPGENAKHYIEVLDAKSQRLKQLTEDLVEAAKATSGNIELEMMPLTFDELMKQALGEFEDKYEKRNLTIIASYPKKPAVVMADGRRLFRIIENVLQNIYKYAMEGTRVYADLAREGDKIVFTLKNVSAAPLNISPDELMERFTRGDSSRTTEGSGLGLSIAKDLTRLQNGEFEIQLDGDLFKVIIRFPEHK